MKTARILILVLMVAALSGCASLLGGGTYEFQKNPDGTCSLKVDSNREVEGPLNVTITENCGIQVNGGAVGGGAGLDQQTILRALLGGGE